MTPEQKLEEDNHKKADEIKAQGNEEFKKKIFDEAIKLYQQAIELYPTRGRGIWALTSYM